MPPRILLSFLFLIFFSSYSFAQQQITNPAASVDPATQAAAKAEQLSQEIRAEERNAEFSHSGIKWVPWLQAGKTIQEMIIKRDPDYKTLISNPRHADIGIYDMDNNDLPDVILFSWDHCGDQGCLYKIYFDNESKKPQSFFGWDFIPYKKGLMLDHAFFSL